MIRAAAAQTAARFAQDPLMQIHHYDERARCEDVGPISALRLLAMTDRGLGREILRLAREVRAAVPALGTATQRDTFHPAYFIWQIVPEIGHRLGGTEARTTGTLALEPGERSDAAVRDMPGARLREVALQSLDVLGLQQPRPLDALVAGAPGFDAWRLLTSHDDNLLARALDRFAPLRNDDAAPAPGRLWGPGPREAEVAAVAGSDDLPPSIRDFWWGQPGPQGDAAPGTQPARHR